MRTATLLVGLMLLACAGAPAQKRRQPRAPRFEDYPAAKGFTGRPAPAVISGRRARLYRTMIRTQAREGPNFAGHYTLATWGCGTGCLEFAVVDARTGRVYFHPKAETVAGVTYQDEERLQFRRDSRLFIVSGHLLGGGGVEDTGKFYYEWRSNRFRLLRRERVVTDGPPEQSEPL
jgi:hypothetical protein